MTYRLFTLLFNLLFITALPAQHRFTVVKSDAAWRKILSAEAFRVTRQEGTERAFTGAYWDHHEQGHYQCVCCAQVLFTSAHKYDSGTGWPSFYAPANKTSLLEETDRSHGMQRTKITCSRCAAHLGHLFDDGPAPTGMRYCINSVALVFVKKGN